MKDPAILMAEIDANSMELDSLTTALSTATDLMNQAEENWLEVYDKVAESLKDDMEREGRRGDPAEHTIVTAARKQNRVVWTNYRRAKRALDRIEKQIGSVRAALSGRQSHLNGLRGEVSAPVPQPRPAWDQRHAA